MKNFIDLLHAQADAAIAKTYGPSIGPEYLPFSSEVTPATQPQFGHYQCNSALKLAKILGANPREVAQNIVNHFDKSFIQKLEVAGAGFINIFLKPSYIAEGVKQMLLQPFLGIERPHKKEKVIVEFSSPNVAKELHVGHLRSTIIGDSLARLFEFLGYDVLRLNHIGDWGTQFGMLIAYLEKFHPEIFEKEVELSLLMQWYKESKKLFDSDPEFKKNAQLQVVALQSGEPRPLQAWKIICAISQSAYQKIYDLMDIRLIDRGESFYNPYLKEIVDELAVKNLIQISDGAKCVFLDDFKTRDGNPLPMIIQKSDGGYNYDTTDMAALRYRIFNDRADRIICVTDAGQSLHFQMLEKVARLAGYFDVHQVRFDHVPFGVVLGADGKKFKTRSGETEKLIDLLLEAIEQAKAIIQERMPDIAPQELEHMAHVLGIGAIKYADLSSHRLKDYTFSYERMLKFEGNTAAFLLYAYVRCQSIKRKVGKDPDKTQEIHLVHPTEIALALHLRQFPEALQLVAKELLPNRLADYLYRLAEHFNAFFRDCRVEGTPEENSRLLLCEACSEVLKTGLGILGLKTVERM